MASRFCFLFRAVSVLISRPWSRKRGFTIGFTMSESEYNFFDTVSSQFYAKRGFIKDGELLMADPGPVLGLRCHSRPVSMDIFEVGESEGNYIAYISNKEDNCLSVEDTEIHLLRVLDENEEFSDKNSVVFYIFAPFSEESDDEYTPLHKNQCFEFRGRYEFFKAVHGWVLLRFDRVVHIYPQAGFCDLLNDDLIDQ